MQPNLAIHHVCGLDELRLAPLSSANRVVTIPATLVEPHVVEVCGARLRVRDDFDPAQRGAVTLCVRPHSVRFAAAGDDAVGYQENGHNRLSGTVLRQVYLGDSRDYLIDLGPTQIRGWTPPIEDRSVGSTIHLDIAIEDCRIVPGTDARL
ncbi:MAG TPA: TOBE domain-containing protein, partial [Candidatus Elarobacter sp.]|nr:TOBE domain-containing protein [Candidatus Elarobacter sp.]